MRRIQSIALACVLMSIAVDARAEDSGYAAVSDSESWTNIMLIADVGFHGGNKVGNGHTTPNGLTYGTMDDRSLNMRMAMTSWPARSPFSDGATVFGQSVGFSLELWMGVYSLVGGGGSEDTAVRGGLNIDILYPLIQAQTFALVGTFQGGLTGDVGYGGVQFGPGLQGLYQAGSLRVIGEYRFLPLWIGDNVITHDMRAHLQLEVDDSMFLGLFCNVAFTQLREIEGGYTRNLTSLGLEFGF